MANCPKCGEKLTLLDWRPNCPACGVNLVYYGMEEKLLEEADAAESEHAVFQRRVDRLKASFIGSKLTIIRIVLSVLPIAALMTPLCSVTYSGPLIEQTSKTINAVGIYNLVSSINFDDLFTMMGSELLGPSFTGYFCALACALFSAVLAIASLFMLMLSCSPKGNPRNITLNVLTLVSACASAIFFHGFAKGVHAAFPEFISASLKYGVFLYIGVVALLTLLNVAIAVKGVKVKYKQCYVGGIPYEEYTELVKNGTDINVIHEKMAAALEAREAERKEKQRKIEKEKKGGDKGKEEKENAEIKK